MKIDTRRREGALLVVVLACIGISLALTMVAMQATIKQRRHLSRTLQLEQTRLLLDAAACKSSRLYLGGIVGCDRYYWNLDWNAATGGASG